MHILRSVCQRLSDRRSAGKNDHDQGNSACDTVETETTCSYCSVGCSLKLESYGDMLIKANPDKEGAVNKGLTCGKGKWGFDCSVLEDKLEDPSVKAGRRLQTKPTTTKLWF